MVTFDYDNDGWQDIFIANDSHAELPVSQQSRRHFSRSRISGRRGRQRRRPIEAGMGTGRRRHDRKRAARSHRWPSRYATRAILPELGDETFDDATLRTKLSYATFHMSGFGTRFMDYDNDGWRDLFMANGHVLDNIERYHADTKYAEPKMMFRNTGRGVFENVSDQLGPDFQLPRVSRGAAIGDFDNDGDLDILVNNCGQAAAILRNDGGNANHWLEIFLIGTKSNRDGVGARVKVTAGDLVLYDQRKGGMSYQSAQDPRLHFGLGQRSSIDSIEIRLAQRQRNQARRISKRTRSLR